MKRIIACEVLRYELESLGVKGEEAIFLQQGLHRIPDELRSTLQEEIDKLEAGGFRGQIIIGYGLCGNGVVGVKTKHCQLVIAKGEDCIDLLFGSRQLHQQDIVKGNAYYYSPGWVAFSKNIYTEYQRCVPLYGEETARWIVGEMLKGYSRITYIDTGLKFAAQDREYVRKIAATFNLSYDEVRGDLSWLARLLRAEGDDIIKVNPGFALEAEQFQGD
ncbi:MAG: DUF1638 domain-containing protein [Clostridia bacterium]|nr:DUF1638 domain-containing protein [Clostridia bacterium]